MPPVSKAMERKFWKGLCKAFQSLVDDIKTGLQSVFTLDQRTRQFLQSNEVNEYLDRLVGKMVTDVEWSSQRSWRQSVYQTTNSRMMYDLITHEMQGPVGARVNQIIADNAAYIKTLPYVWAQYVTQYAYREGLKGKRPEEIEAELRKKLPGHITKNLKCIARTECAKANAAIVQARAEMCGIKAYFWRCVADERSRSSHIGMDGVLVFYDDPPNPEALFPGSGNPYGRYHAGNTFNCRCYQEPVVDNRFLPDVMRVHDHGKIVTMTKAKVLKTFGNVA